MSLSEFEFDGNETHVVDGGLSIVRPNQNSSPFEQIKHFDGSGKEYWLARELQPLLGYRQWRQFEDCLERAKLACRNSGAPINDHFADIRKMIKAGKGATRELQDYQLSRYGCYLTAMNGDPRKIEIATAQTYFAVKTHEAEAILPAQIKELELKKLDLELIQAKQRYLETSHAIQLSTSLATLAWLRGETPPPPKVEYRDRFIVAATKKEIGSSSGRSLTQLISDAGLNPKSTKHRQKVKHILKNCGFDYDREQGWVMASYLNKYPVLEDQTYEQALRAVLAEIANQGTEANLFVHHLQQSALTGQPQSQALQLEGVEN